MCTTIDHSAYITIINILWWGCQYIGVSSHHCCIVLLSVMFLSLKKKINIHNIDINYNIYCVGAFSKFIKICLFIHTILKFEYRLTWMLKNVDTIQFKRSDVLPSWSIEGFGVEANGIHNFIIWSSIALIIYKYRCKPSKYFIYSVKIYRLFTENQSFLPKKL